MIPESYLFDQSTVMNIIDSDEVVKGYRALFSLFDWSIVDRWEAEHAGQGSHGHPMSAYIKAFLVRINEGIIYTSRLRAFLVKHPLLVIELGFHLKLDYNSRYGFDYEKTVPCEPWLRTRLRTFDQNLLRDLLNATVVDLIEEIPGLGEIIAYDVKHIYAWVKENNKRVYVKDRYDKNHRPAGDPDCRLGVKKRSNQEQADGTRHAKKSKVFGATVQAWLLQQFRTMVMPSWPNIQEPSTRMISRITVLSTRRP